MPPIVPPSCLSFYHTPRAPLPRFPRQRHRPSSSSSSTFLLLPLLFPFSLSPPALSLLSSLPYSGMRACRPHHHRYSLQCDGGIDLKVHSCFHNAVSVPTLKRTLLPPRPPLFLLFLSFSATATRYLARVRPSVRLASPPPLPRLHPALVRPAHHP